MIQGYDSLTEIALQGETKRLKINWIREKFCCFGRKPEKSDNFFEEVGGGCE
jgi:hypothetical protein